MRDRTPFPTRLIVEPTLGDGAPACRSGPCPLPSRWLVRRAARARRGGTSSRASGRPCCDAHLGAACLALRDQDDRLRAEARGFAGAGA